MLHGERRDDRVRHQRSRGLSVREQRLQDVPVTFTWLHDPRHRVGELGGHCCRRLADAERPLESARIGGDANERPKRQPGEADQLLAAESWLASTRITDAARPRPVR